MESKKWMRLDNAALIYPPSVKKKYAMMFRLTISFKDKIDKDILAEALRNTLVRLPSFAYRLRRGLLWYYLEKIDGIPPILDDVKNPMRMINFKDNNYFMFRVRVYEKRLALEFFHALTDGTGGVTLLLTLSREYIRLKYGVETPYTDKILNLNDKPKKEEYEDSFKRHVGDVGSLEKEEAAYHLKGRLLPSHMLNIITGKMKIDALKKLCMEYDCTITVFLTSIMFMCFQEIQNNNHDKKKKPIKVSIPVNLRKFFDSITLRNFSSYVNPKIDTKLGDYTLEEVIKEVKGQLEYMVNEKKLRSKFTGNVNMERKIWIRLMPTFIKMKALSISDYLMGDRYCTTTFSNYGLINIPEEMQKYVTEMGFMIGRSRNKHGAVACISCMNNLYITFTSRIYETEFERLFFTKLVSLGIKVSIESNHGGM
ncbi:MAG: hypothetical protein J6X02_03695 [Bacilli bacterium]|nr:hypothetical protein [Bacilli bacterium]